MIVRNSYASHWELIGNMTTHARHIHFESNGFCEAKPTTLKRPSPGEGLRITCLVMTIKETQNPTWVFRPSNLLIPLY